MPPRTESRRSQLGPLASPIGTALFVALQYPLGALADRFGRRPQLLVFTAATALLSVPLSTLIGSGLAGLTAVFRVGLGLYTAQTSIAPALMSELFPTKIRALNVTVAPLVINALAAAGPSTLFFWYLTAVAVISFLVVLTLPQTKGKTLTWISPWRRGLRCGR